MPEEKLTRMKADTFRARLRLGLGFPSAVHVPESLKIQDTAVETLCDTLCVDGSLDLTGCANLRSLPARLVVRGKLTLDGCVQLTALPSSVREVFGFSAVGCELLTSIGSIVECRGRLDLTACTSLAPLADRFIATGRVTLSGCSFHHDCVVLPSGTPETVMLSLPGRRLGDVISHRLLPDHPVFEAIISAAQHNAWLGGPALSADCSALVRPEKKVK